MIILIIGLVLFLGIHSVKVVAPVWREAQIAKLGEGPWKGIYSLVSLTGLGLIVLGYWLAREDAPVFYGQAAWFRPLALIAMPIVLIVFFAGNFRAGYIKRVLKHPMLIGTIFWSAIHLIGNGDLASIFLFGGFLLWAAIDFVSASRRPYAAQAETAWWPDVVSVALGLVVSWLLISWLHGWLFGVALS